MSKPSESLKKEVHALRKNPSARPWLALIEEVAEQVFLRKLRELAKKQ